MIALFVDSFSNAEGEITKRDYEIQFRTGQLCTEHNQVRSHPFFSFQPKLDSMSLRSLFKFVDPYYIRQGIKNPSEAINTLKNEIKRSDTSMDDPCEYDNQRAKHLSAMFDVEDKKIRSLINDAREGWVNERLSKCRGIMEEYPYRVGGMQLGGETAYIITKLINPSNICEIGVANGVSTLYTLGALKDMDALDADVVGIDRPQFETEFVRRRNKRALVGGTSIIPDDREAGWFCPIELKRCAKYQYYAADLTVVPDIVETMNGIDFALYDASKDEKKMRSTYIELIESLNSGGVLLSDDVNVNYAFEEVTNDMSGSSVTIGDIGVYRHPQNS